MAEAKLVFTDKVLDNVHGFIELTEVESEIISLPIFKRLRHIKQLSLANWVFPGAEHTRYIHSLGVMYVIDQMAIKLHYDDKERQTVRLAGLLHDLGHYPLSHVGEGAYKDSSIVDPNGYIESAKQECKRKIDKLKEPYVEVDGLMTVHNNKFHHERITADLIRNNKELQQIIHKHCSYIKPDVLCAIITGNVQFDSDISDMVQLLHSELDADRIDYLMRDATFSGTSYGGFELGLLLDNLVCRDNGEVKIVGIKPKGIPSADQFLINRFFSYSQIVFNKHVSALGYMATKIMAYERDHKELFPTHAGLEEMLKKVEKENGFLRFTDTVFWESIRKLAESNECESKEIKKFAEMLSVYDELEPIRETEVRYSGKQKSAYGEIKKSSAYKRLSKKNSCNVLPIFEECKITKQVPIAQFEKALAEAKEKTDCEDVLIDTYRTRRLQEGLAVIDGDDIHLLVDDKRSMIASLYDVAVYLLREYKCEV